MIGRLRGLGRRLVHADDIGLDPLETEFVRIARETFAFLERDWKFRAEVSGMGTDEIQVLLVGDAVGIEITFSGWENLMLFALPLRKGRKPQFFDAQLNDLYTGFALDQYFSFVDPSWERPQRTHVDTPDKIAAALRPYGSELARYGERLLRGDPELLATMRDEARRKAIDTYLSNWSRFVERVRLGFDGSVFEYTEAVTARAQLDSMLKLWEGDRRHDPTDEITRTDRIFDDTTEPLAWGKGKNVILPTPTAKRWWRRPKWLVGPLREYFERQASR